MKRWREVLGLLCVLTGKVVCSTSCEFEWVPIGEDIQGEPGDESGTSVDVSADGNIIAMGSPKNRNGVVRVYAYDDTHCPGIWKKIGEIEGESYGDQSGMSVSLSDDGKTVAIGAPWNDSSIFNEGHVRVYSYIGTTWTQLGLDLYGENYDDFSGSAVSLSSDGRIVAIGSPGHESQAGKVRIFSYGYPLPGRWNKMGPDIIGEANDDELGSSVALSGDGYTVAIGSPEYDGEAGFSTGHVKVYSFSSGSWTPKGNAIEGESFFTYSGTSVSLSKDGNKLAIGSPLDAGHVKVYIFDDFSTSPPKWVQISSDIDGEMSQAQAGTSVSLASDGFTVAVGQPGKDIVIVKTLGSEDWITVGNRISGSSEDENFGASVSIAGNREVVAIGAPKSNKNGRFSGYTRVLQFGCADPCKNPSSLPTMMPKTEIPSYVPTLSPRTHSPSNEPSNSLSVHPTLTSTQSPSNEPTSMPSVSAKSQTPSNHPLDVLSASPTTFTTQTPSNDPTSMSSISPKSQVPSNQPSDVLSTSPTISATPAPSYDPSSKPSIPSKSQELSTKPTITFSANPSVPRTQSPEQLKTQGSSIGQNTKSASSSRISFGLLSILLQLGLLLVGLFFHECFCDFILL